MAHLLYIYAFVLVYEKNILFLHWRFGLKFKSEFRLKSYDFITYQDSFFSIPLFSQLKNANFLQRTIQIAKRRKSEYFFVFV